MNPIKYKYKKYIEIHINKSQTRLQINLLIAHTPGNNCILSFHFTLCSSPPKHNMQLSDDSETEVASKIQGLDLITFLKVAKKTAQDEGEGLILLYCILLETCVLWYERAKDMSNPPASFDVTLRIYTGTARLFNKHTTYDCWSDMLALSISLSLCISTSPPLLLSFYAR